MNGSQKRSMALLMRFVTPCIAMLLCTGAATAQYSSDFEGVVGHEDGQELNGQDGYYNPDPPNSISALVYTYADNALGIPDNPTGGAQFIAGTGPGGNVFSRSQRDVDYGAGDVITISYDFVATFDNKGVSTQNVGSFSTQLFPGAATYIHLMQWNDPNDPVSYNARYIAYDAGGTLFASPYKDGISGPEWEDLQIDRWYRATTTFDLALNEIVHCSIVDLETGEGAEFEPTGWYLEGGAAGGLPPPSGFRFFAGAGATDGNVLGFDNIDIVSVEECPWDLDDSGDTGTNDLILLLGSWGDPYDTADLIELLGAWGPCP